MKYIYLIQSLENGYYKIGVSKHPQKRIQGLQTGNPSPTKLIETYYTEHANQIERALQRRYSHLRREGEWFDLSITEEVGFKSECQKIEETIEFLKKSGNVFI
jgi:hypothetical protein